MSEYIKREDAQRALVHTLKEAEIDTACNEQDWYCQGLMDAGVAIDAIPSADVVEVRHGYWEKIAKVRPECKWDSDYNYECSECHYTDVHNEEVDVPYCWHCGARMDGEEE